MENDLQLRGGDPMSLRHPVNTLWLDGMCITFEQYMMYVFDV